MSVDGGMKSGAHVGGVSSGGSVNSDCVGVVLRHPKNAELIQSDAITLQSPSRQHYQQQQQRRWSEYRDPFSDGQFTRSASARLPRQLYQNDEIDSRFVDQQQKCTSDVNDGEKKIQQVNLSIPF
jgi:mannosyltransferase OCH1-like enzyme